jgi:peptide/nickel transport system substrate-binding protein
MSFTRRTALAAGVAMCFLVAAGGSSGSTRSSSGVNATVVVSFRSDWTNFDMQVNEGMVSTSLTGPAYDRLVARGPGLKIVPYVATSWKTTPTSVTFKLRKNVVCSDGTKLTPLNIAQSFERLVTVPKVSNQLKNYFGPGPYHLKANRYAGTFTFTVDTPFRNLLGGFALMGSGIICPAGLRALAADPHALETHMYGSGPYTLVSSVHGDNVTFQLRPAWKWGPAGKTTKDMPTTLVYKIVSDQTTAANLLLTGGINVTGQPIVGADAARLKADTSLVRKVSPNYFAYPLTFNMFPGHITNDPIVREALSMAVVPKDFLQAAFFGNGVVSNSIEGPGSECYSKANAKYLPKPSLTAARALLVSHGWAPDSKGILAKNGDPLNINLLGNSSTLGNAGQYLASIYKQLGASVTLQDSPAVFTRMYLAAQFDVTVTYFSVATPDAGQDLVFFTGPPLPVGFNVANTGTGDAAYNANAQAASRTIGSKACKYFDNVTKTYLQKHYVLPLAAPQDSMFGKGWDFLPLAGYFEPAFLKQVK